MPVGERRNVAMPAIVPDKVDGNEPPTDDKKSKDKKGKTDKPNDDRDPKSPNDTAPFFD